MKKILVLIILLFSSAAIAQSWTELKETNITVGTNAYDIFTNSAGNHIIVQEPNALNYYKMGVNGTAGTPIQIEHNVSVISPSISGDATKIYVVYRKSNETSIKTKYSLDGGVSWLTLNESPINSNASSIECVFLKNTLHVTYLVGTVVYHSFYDLENPPWSNPYQVYGNNTTSDPRIAAWNEGGYEQVFITYMSGTHFRWTRYDVNATQNQYHNGFFNYGANKINLGIGLDDQYIYGFYKDQITYNLSWVGKSWNDPGDIFTGTQGNNNHVSKMFNTATADNRVFSACWSTDATPSYIARLFFDHSDPTFYDEIYSDPSLTPVGIVNLSAAGNDVHVIWKDNLGTNNGNNLRYKYYDDYPIPPKNLTITRSPNNHPLLSWTNPQPDVTYYKIYRINFCSGGWQLIGQTANLYYEDETLSYCTAIPPAQCEEQCIFHFKITAVDIGLKESEYSNIVWSSLVGGGKPSKTGVNELDVESVFGYSLGQNYPNPFNPTTQISYSLAQDAFVTLKVYDMLGNKVTELVNGGQTAGVHEISFDASELSSGIYIYRVTAMNGERILFSESKQMLLMK